MTPKLLNYLCEPVTKEPLQLVDAVTGAVSGDHVLRSADGPIALGAGLGSVFGKVWVLCDGRCAQIAG